MIWILISAILLIALILVIAKKIRPFWKKLILIFLILVGILLSVFKFIFPLNEGPKPMGPYGVKNEKSYYIHKTEIPKMATSGSDREVPVSWWLPEDENTKHPLVIFSHGSFGIEDSNSSLFEELASNGYIVASLGHPYHSFITSLSDGSDVYVDSSFFQSVMDSQGSENLEKTREGFNEWKSIRVEDISFVLDSILSDEKYSSKIDQEKIFLSGHSLGGSAALEVGRNRANALLGIIALESPFFGDIVGIEGEKYLFSEKEYPLPVLHFYSDALWGKLDEITTYEMNQKLLESNNPKYVNVHVEGSGHIGLSELSLASPFLTNLFDNGMNSKPALEKIEEINKATLEFLDRLTK